MDQPINWEEKYLPMIKRIAHHMMGILPPNVDVQDLIQEGSLGLLDAMEKFRPESGSSFETYANYRIRGAMIDSLRKNDWASRSMRKDRRDIDRATSKVEQEKLRKACDGEVALALGLSLSEYFQMQSEMHTLVHLEDLRFDEDDSWEEKHRFLPLSGEMASLRDPLVQLEEVMTQKSVSEALAELPPKLASIISMYHDEEMNLREIGERLGVSESRVCQLYGDVVVVLRKKLNAPSKSVPSCINCLIVSTGMYSEEEVDVILAMIPGGDYCANHKEKHEILVRMAHGGIIEDDYDEDF